MELSPPPPPPPLKTSKERPGIVWVVLLGHSAAAGGGADVCAHLEVTIHHKAVMHVLKTQDDLCCVETHLSLREDPVLGEVVM